MYINVYFFLQETVLAIDNLLDNNTQQNWQQLQQVTIPLAIAINYISLVVCLP